MTTRLSQKSLPNVIEGDLKGEEGEGEGDHQGKQTEPNQNHGLYTRLKAVVLYYSR